MEKVVDYEIINHGYEHSQYFQGCGTTFTNFDMVITGIGDNAKEAYKDAVEQVATIVDDVEMLPNRPKGIRKRDVVPAKCSEDFYWFVSIRFNVGG